jgi:hypothetical protein
MTFVLIELDSVEALGLVTLAGKNLSIDGLDEGWNKTFVGAYFYVHTGKGDGGASAMRTRMTEGTLEDP